MATGDSPFIFPRCLDSELISATQPPEWVPTGATPMTKPLPTVEQQLPEGDGASPLSPLDPLDAISLSTLDCQASPIRHKTNIEAPAATGAVPTDDTSLSVPVSSLLFG